MSKNIDIPVSEVSEDLTVSETPSTKVEDIRSGLRNKLPSIDQEDGNPLFMAIESGYGGA